MSNLNVLQLIQDLKSEFPYITKCVKEMHQADVGAVHSLTSQFEHDGTAGKYAQREQSKSLKQPHISSGLSERIARKQEQIRQHESQRMPQKMQQKRNDREL